MHFDESPSLPFASKLLLCCYAAATSPFRSRPSIRVGCTPVLCVGGGLETGKCWNLEPTNGGGADDGVIRQWQREGQRCRDDIVDSFPLTRQ